VAEGDQDEEDFFAADGGGDGVDDDDGVALAVPSPSHSLNCCDEERLLQLGRLLNLSCSARMAKGENKRRVFGLNKVLDVDKMLRGGEGKRNIRYESLHPLPLFRPRSRRRPPRGERERCGRRSSAAGVFSSSSSSGESGCGAAEARGGFPLAGQARSRRERIAWQRRRLRERPIR